MLKTVEEFERRPDLLARADALLSGYSISCISPRPRICLSRPSAAKAFAPIMDIGGSDAH
jgi:hypothetical protein